jgi:hypothetical protein
LNLATKPGVNNSGASRRKKGTPPVSERVVSCICQPCDPPPQAKEARGAPDAEKASQPEPEPVSKHGTKIRETLATVFGGCASGGALFKACGIKNATYYAAFKIEIEEDRIRKVGKGRYPEYELTPKAPEYRTPTPSPTPETPPESESQPSPAHVDRDYDSDSDTHPVGVSCPVESESRVEGTEIGTQQDQSKPPRELLPTCSKNPEPEPSREDAAHERAGGEETRYARPAGELFDLREDPA